MTLENNNKNNLIMYITLLFVSLIVSNIAVLSLFTVFNNEVIVSSFTYPFVFYFANKIIKIVDKKTFFEIIVGIVFLSLLVFNILFDGILSVNIASVSTFFISQMIFLFLSSNLLNKKKNSMYIVLSTYSLIIIIDAIIFNVLNNQTFGLSLLFSIIFKIIVGKILALIDYKTSKNS